MGFFFFKIEGSGGEDGGENGGNGVAAQSAFWLDEATVGENGR